MAQDWLPSADADLGPWLMNFLTYANNNKVALGLTSADLGPVQTAFENWSGAYEFFMAASAGYESALHQKDNAADAVPIALRPLVNRIQASPVMTDAHRGGLGITVRSTTRTATAAPTTRPVATIDTSQSLRHTIAFVDELTPTSRAKPPGVTGCEIWVKVGDAPTGPGDLTYLALDTRSPYVAEYDGADVGKIAHYRLRWLSTRGERGPWSQTVSGTITA